MYAPEAVDQMHFFQHSRQGLPPKPNAWCESHCPRGRAPRDGRWLPGKFRIFRAESRNWREPCRKRPPLQSNPPWNTSPPRAAAEGRGPPPACYKWGEVGHYRRNCPRTSGAKATGNTGGGWVERRPELNKGPAPQTKGADGQQPGTGDRALRGPRTVRVLTPERAEPTATPRIPRILPPSVQIASQTPELGLHWHPGFRCPSLMPQGEEEASQLVEREPRTSPGGSLQRNPGAGWTAPWPGLGIKETSASEDSCDPLGRLLSGSRCKGPPWRQWWTLAPKCWARRCITGSRKSPPSGGRWLCCQCAGTQ